jgi:hypothetical protein
LVVCVVGLVAAIAALVANRRTWDEYGQDRLTMDRDPSRGDVPESASGSTERDAEIRQLLQARNARKRRRGEPPIDVERELTRLTAPRIDPDLRAEIRDLVIARNHRRQRAGKPPLDVEAEIERQIANLPR